MTWRRRLASPKELVNRCHSPVFGIGWPARNGTDPTYRADMIEAANRGGLFSVKITVNDDGAATHNGGRALCPNRSGGRDRRDGPSHARVHGPG